MSLTSQNTAQVRTSASEEVDLDELCINTIRTLAMDAVQKANSGHPGTPMALAPVAYALWQQFLRYDPKEPAWPNRDRFVLSNGHASMLLYAAAASCRREGQGRAGGEPRRHQAVPPARQQMSGPSRIWPDRRRRDDHRAAGAGLRQLRRHGDRIALAGRALQSPRLRPLRLRRLCDVRRRRHDGRHFQRSGLACRPSEARQPVLDLRQQPHHHRRPYRPGLRRRCRRALPRLWLARRAREGRQRHRVPRQGLRRLLQPDGRADDDHRRQPHRLRRAAQAGHRRRARRAAGRRRDPPRQAQLRLAGGCAVPRARMACASISTKASASAAPSTGRTGRS